jgi:hypothetical protein
MVIEDVNITGKGYARIGQTIAHDIVFINEDLLIYPKKSVWEDTM